MEGGGGGAILTNPPPSLSFWKVEVEGSDFDRRCNALHFFGNKRTGSPMGLTNVLKKCMLTYEYIFKKCVLSYEYIFKKCAYEIFSLKNVITCKIYLVKKSVSVLTYKIYFLYT